MEYIRKFWLLYLITGLIFLSVVTGGNRAVTVISENTPILREHIYIIDAGHGGVDGGATSCSGVLESQINLEIALKLNDLMHLLGMDTVMVRTSDISIYSEGANTIAAKKVSDLKNRVKLVNGHDNGILISIHQNTFSDSRYSGAQVFYNSGEAKTMAVAVQKSFQQIDPDNRRTSKQAKGVYLMQHIQRPGLLIECGFLSNPEEDAKLKNPDYQRKLCSVIATSILLSNT